MVDKDRNSVIIESPQGVQYQRNVTHVKKYNTPTPSSLLQDYMEEDGMCDHARSQEGQRDTHMQDLEDPQEEVPAAARPTRTRQVPKRFEDFVMD